MSMRLPILCMALAFASAAYAQEPPQHIMPAPVPQPPGPPTTSAVATVSATGCLERWRPEGSDTTAKPPEGVQFVLTQVDGRAVSETAAGGGLPTRPAPATRYLLMAPPSIALAPHLNHRVKIDGTVAPQPTQGATLVDNIQNPAARETNLPEAPEPKSYRDNLVEVSALSMVARECPKK